MNRRLLAGLAGLAVVGLSACSTVRPNAATVGDTEIRRNDFEEEMQDLGGTATASTDQVRQWLTDRIRFAVADQAVAAQHLTVSDENRTQGETLAKQQWSNYDTLPASLKDRLRDGFAAELALAATAAPPPTDQTVSQALNGKDGTLCITAIPAQSEDDAKTIVADLQSGKALADVVEPRVAGTQLEGTHGAVVDQNGQCPTASQLNDAVNQAVANVKINAPSAPVELGTASGQSSWVVLVPTKAGDADAAAIEAALKASPASVSIDRRYGTWNADSLSVVSGVG